MKKLPPYALAMLKARALLVLALGVFCLTPIAAAAPPSARSTPAVKTGNVKVPPTKGPLTKAKPISAPSAGRTSIHSKGPQSTTPTTTQNAGHTKVPQGTTQNAGHTKVPQGTTQTKAPQGNTHTKVPPNVTNTKVPQVTGHTPTPTT